MYNDVIVYMSELAIAVRTAGTARRVTDLVHYYVTHVSCSHNSQQLIFFVRRTRSCVDVFT